VISVEYRKISHPRVFFAPVDGVSLGIGYRWTESKTRSSADADNKLDAFSGQSRSTNMVPFHMLHIVSYCAIVTLSLRYSPSKNFMTLKLGSKVTQGHWEWYHSI